MYRDGEASSTRQLLNELMLGFGDIIPCVERCCQLSLIFLLDEMVRLQNIEILMRYKM